jgi:TonB family protein
MLTAVLALIVVLANQALAANAREVRARVAPVYPEIAKRMKITGAVSVEATVDANGNVTQVKTISGSHFLSPAAEAAVLRWKFEPADARSTVEVQVDFTLSD